MALAFRTELDPEVTGRIRSAVNLGIGVGDARFQAEIMAAEQAKRNGGRKRKEVQVPAGQQVDLF